MLTVDDVALRLASGFAVGGAIGLERQFNQKMAGLRTNALVAFGAAGFVCFTAMANGGLQGSAIPGQIISGIGFLGGGVILREGASVHGLNTAATLWCSAMVGALAGGGFYPAAGLAAAGIITINVVLRPFVRHMNKRLMRKRAELLYTIVLTVAPEDLSAVRGQLRGVLQADDYDIRELEQADTQGSTARLTLHVAAPVRDAAAADLKIDGYTSDRRIKSRSWSVERILPDD